MYMTVSSGIAMEIHYCMGKHSGADLYGTSSGKCGRCGMKEQKKSGCCHDDHKFYKLEDSHKKSVNDHSFQIGEMAVENKYPVFNWLIPEERITTLLKNHSPPLFIKPPARIFHGVFRI